MVARRRLPALEICSGDGRRFNKDAILESKADEL